MSINPVSASNPTNLSSLFAGVRGPRRHDDEDGHSSGEGTEQGVTVLASLLQALIQAVGAQSAAAAGGAEAASSPSGTAADSSATSGAGATTGAGAGTDTGTAASSLVDDLRAFLHDLVHALREVGRSDHENSGLTGTTSTPAATAADTAAGTGAAASTAAAATTGAAAYRYRHGGVVARIQTLVHDLAAGYEGTNTDTAPAPSSHALSNLNSAFQKLIADLSGSPSGTGGVTSGTAGNSSTAALQSFLTNFAQDLQNNGTHSLNSLGSSVNTSA
jgi:hypothetical protein